MYYGMYVSAAGAHALSQQVEVLSNNLANVDTVGFKRNLALMEARDSESVERGLVTRGSQGLEDLSGGVRLMDTPADFSMGVMKETGKSTDFALEKPLDFFLIQRGDEQLLTRAGNFHVSADGRLMTEQGDAVLSNDATPIQVDPNVPWRVHNNGMIEQAGAFVSLGLRRAANQADLVKVGDNAFAARLTPAEAVPDNERVVRNGVLEHSSVQPTREMVDLIAASRGYEANVRMIQHHDGMVGSLVSRVLRA